MVQPLEDGGGESYTLSPLPLLLFPNEMFHDELSYGTLLLISSNT